MHDLTIDKRNVIPRWRPLVAIEKSDLASLGRFSDKTHTNKAADYAEQIKIWRKDRDVAAAADIFDTYLLTRDPTLLLEARSIVEGLSHLTSNRLRSSLEFVSTLPVDPLDLRRRIAFQETSSDYLQRSIAILKKRLTEFPRDALSYLELARLYAVSGQYDQSENALYRARVLAPENRVILRSTIQFYNIVSNLEHGLSIVRRSDRIKFDPWIQSAEIATSHLLGKSSRVASRKLLNAVASHEVSRDQSELAMALATLERDSGLADRKVFQFVGRALPNSTENGFAQAIWLSDQSSKGFLKRFPHATPSAEAYEARVKLAFAERDFETASGFAELWVEDQPFSAAAVIHLFNLRSVHLSPTPLVLDRASRAIHFFSDNWQVLNASALVLTEGQRFDEARHAIERLKRVAPDGAPQAYVYAAEGFLSFARRDLDRGRKFYELAVKTGREHRKGHLVVDATMFWMRCEIDNNLIAPEFKDRLSDLIEGALKKLPQGEREYLESVWHSIKLRVDSSLEREQTILGELGADLVLVAKKHLEEDDFF